MGHLRFDRQSSTPLKGWRQSRGPHRNISKGKLTIFHNQLIYVDALPNSQADFVTHFPLLVDEAHNWPPKNFESLKE
jgi:hypothetical protein